MRKKRQMTAMHAAQQQLGRVVQQAGGAVGGGGGGRDGTGRDGKDVHAL